MLKNFIVMACLLMTGLTQAQFWTESYSGFATQVTGISKFDIVNSSTTWAVGYDGINPNNNIQKFAKTIDGGVTWTEGDINVGNSSLGVGNISAIDDLTAYVSIYPRTAGQTGGIWKTVDGGATWNQEASAGFSSSSSFLNIVHYFDASRGVAIGDPVNGYWEIYITNDAGNTYNRVASAQIPAPLAGETGYIAQFDVFLDSIWFTTSEGRIYHSINRGATWSVYQSPINDFGGTNISGDISFATTSRGVIQDDAGNLYKTVDAGQTWNNIIISGVGAPYGGAIAYLPNTFHMVSTGGDPNFSGSSYSLDDGVTWTNIDTEQHVGCVFLNDQTGFSGGFSNSTSQEGVYRYTSNVLNIQDQNSQALFGLSPVPAKDWLTINSKFSLDKVTIYDVHGRIMTSDSNSMVNVSGFPSGLYLIKVATSVGTQTTKFLKQ